MFRCRALHCGEHFSPYKGKKGIKMSTVTISRNGEETQVEEAFVELARNPMRVMGEYSTYTLLARICEHCGGAHGDRYRVVESPAEVLYSEAKDYYGDSRFFAIKAENLRFPSPITGTLSVEIITRPSDSRLVTTVQVEAEFMVNGQQVEGESSTRFSIPLADTKKSQITSRLSVTLTDDRELIVNGGHSTTEGDVFTRATFEQIRPVPPEVFSMVSNLFSEQSDFDPSDLLTQKLSKVIRSARQSNGGSMPPPDLSDLLGMNGRASDPFSMRGY